MLDRCQHIITNSKAQLRLLPFFDHVSSLCSSSSISLLSAFLSPLPLSLQLSYTVPASTMLGPDGLWLICPGSSRQPVGVYVAYRESGKITIVQVKKNLPPRPVDVVLREGNRTVQG